MRVGYRVDRGCNLSLTSSHDVADIEHVADRAIVVNHGSIIYDAPVAVMRSELLATKRIEVRFEGPVAATALGSLLGPGSTVSEDGPGQVAVDVDTTQQPVRQVLDTVLRYLTVKVDEDVDPEARPSDVTPETLAAAAETKPDEEDYYLGRTTAEGEAEEAPAGDGEAIEGERVEATSDDATAPEAAVAAEAVEQPESVDAATVAEGEETPSEEAPAEEQDKE